MSIVFLRRRRLGAGSISGMIAALTAAGIASRCVRSWLPEELNSITPEDTVVRWGCTATVRAEHIVNSARSIHWCSDKKSSRLAMQETGVPVPETWEASAFFGDYVRNLVTDMGQLVLRPAHHAQGRQLWHGPAAYIAGQISRGNGTDGYVSRLINKVAEYRVFCVKGTVAWVARKTPGNPEDIAWNVARGGHFDNVRWNDWPTKVIDAALRGAAVSGVDFGGVDVMVDAEGNPYVLEINSAPSQTSPYRQRCAAFALAWAVDAEAVAAPEWHERRTYKSYINPAVRQRGD